MFSKKRRILGKEITLTRTNRKKLLEICKSIQPKTRKIKLKKINVKRRHVIINMPKKPTSSVKKSSSSASFVLAPTKVPQHAELPVAKFFAQLFPKVDTVATLLAPPFLKVDKFKQQGMSYLETLSQKELD